MRIKQFEFSMFGVNTYVVWDEASRECAVIDPACTTEAEWQSLSSFIASEKLTVKHLINTHLHLDHTFGDQRVAEAYGVGLEASPLDAFLGADRQGQADMFHLPMRLPPLQIDVELHQGDRIWLGKEWMEVLEVPGHSPGSLVLWCPADGWLITGDVLFRGSIGRTDLPGGSHSQLVEGIRSKLLPLPGGVRVFPGHGPFTTLAEEAASNPYL